MLESWTGADFSLFESQLKYYQSDAEGNHERYYALIPELDFPQHPHQLVYPWNCALFDFLEPSPSFLELIARFVHLLAALYSHRVNAFGHFDGIIESVAYVHHRI